MTNHDVLEAVARAICDHTRELTRYDDLDEHQREYWRGHAQAALTALQASRNEGVTPPGTEQPPSNEDRMREALRRARGVIATRLFDPDELAAIDAALGSGGE